MQKIVLKIDGMQCGMCESHVNDAVRKVADVKSVKSSHAKGTTEIVCEDGLDEKTVVSAVEAQGYRVLSVDRQPYEKKGLFSFFRK